MKIDPQKVLESASAPVVYLHTGLEETLVGVLVSPEFFTELWTSTEKYKAGDWLAHTHWTEEDQSALDLRELKEELRTGIEEIVNNQGIELGAEDIKKFVRNKMDQAKLNRTIK